MELLLMYLAIIILFSVAALMMYMTLGLLLLIDFIFKTHFGRRVCRWIFINNDPI